MKIKNNRIGYIFSIIILSGLFAPAILYAEDENSIPTTTPKIVGTETVSSTVSTEINFVSTTSTETNAVTSTSPAEVNFVSTTTPATNPDFAQLTIRIDNTIIFYDSVAINNATTTVTDNQNKTYDVADN